jgi:hypothetical protein
LFDSIDRAYDERPAVSAKGTVNPSAKPMMKSRSRGPLVLCRSFGFEEVVDAGTCVEAGVRASSGSTTFSLVSMLAEWMGRLRRGCKTGSVTIKSLRPTIVPDSGCAFMLIDSQEANTDDDEELSRVC